MAPQNGESSKALVAAPPAQTPKQLFAALGNFFKIQSDACLKFAGSEAVDTKDPQALAELVAALAQAGAAVGVTSSGKLKTSAQLDRAEKKRKRTEKNASKDPNAPKRPASAYLMYQNECRDEVKKSMPEGAPYQDTLKKIGEMWKELAPEYKEIYTNRANEAMAGFKATAEAYEVKKGKITEQGVKAALAAANSDDDELDDAAAAESGSASDDDDDESDEDESDEEEPAPPPPPPAKKAKKAAPAPEPVAATPNKKDKKDKKAAAAAPVVEAPSSKKSKKDKKASA